MQVSCAFSCLGKPTWAQSATPEIASRATQESNLRPTAPEAGADPSEHSRLEALWDQLGTATERYGIAGDPSVGQSLHTVAGQLEVSHLPTAVPARRWKKRDRWINDLDKNAQRPRRQVQRNSWCGAPSPMKSV